MALSTGQFSKEIKLQFILKLGLLSGLEERKKITKMKMIGNPGPKQASIASWLCSPALCRNLTGQTSIPSFLLTCLKQIIKHNTGKASWTPCL